MNSEAALIEEIERIESIKLIGAPSILIIDRNSLFNRNGEIPDTLIKKINYLSKVLFNEIIVISELEFEKMIFSYFKDISNLWVRDKVPDSISGIEVIGILSKVIDVPNNSYIWFVGDNDITHNNWHPSDYKNDLGSDLILGYLGTAFVQEKAGLAFRGEDRNKLPQEGIFDKVKILNGISNLIKVDADSINELVKYYSNINIKLNEDYEDFIHQAFPVIEAAVEPTGSIIASPHPASDNFPDYHYFWQRDGAEIIIALNNLYLNGEDEFLQYQAKVIINGYINFLREFPKNLNLGISRFTVEGMPIDRYGNPQDDGAALTVLAIIDSIGETEESLYLIKPYLKYLSDEANNDLSYDCWELSVGIHFNVLNLKRRAFKKASIIAKSIGFEEDAKHYFEISEKFKSKLKEFYNQEKGIINSSKNIKSQWMEITNDIDINIIGSILSGYDEIDLRDSFLNVDDPSISKTIEIIEKENKDKWPVNIAWRKCGFNGLGIGRFPTDMNDGFGSTGGNPWVFATLWYCQYYYRLIQRYEFTKKQFDKNELLSKADGSLKFVLAHVSANELTEQINGINGKPQGAKKLTWAHGELINTLLIRNEVILKL